MNKLKVYSQRTGNYTSDNFSPTPNSDLNTYATSQLCEREREIVDIQDYLVSLVESFGQGGSYYVFCVITIFGQHELQV